METRVAIGVRVVLEDAAGLIEELKLVCPASTRELNLEHGQISVNSPVGRALLGHKAGEEITVETPSGERRYRIVDVKLATSAETSGAHAARR